MSTSARACAQVPTYVAVTAMAIVMTHSLAVCDAVVFKMNDPGILYSPYNWGVTVDGAKTINPGAYFSTIFQGETMVLHTNTSLNTKEPYSQFWTRVDGGPLTAHTIAPGSPSYNVTMCDPTCTASNTHLLEVIIKSTTETISRWSPQTTSITFTGLEPGATGALVLPRRRPFNVIIYGDSITEGVRTMGYQGIPFDTDHNDAVRDYSYQLYASLPVEVGVVGFGATGVVKAMGSGGVPSLPMSYNYMWEGEPRDFTTFPPDVVIYNEGTNDGANITADFLKVVQGIAKVAPKAKQLLLLPFDGSHKQDILAVVAEAASPNVIFGDTTGFYSGADGLHPFGYNHIAEIAPKMAALVAPLLVK